MLDIKEFSVPQIYAFFFYLDVFRVSFFVKMLF